MKYESDRSVKKSKFKIQTIYTCLKYTCIFVTLTYIVLWIQHDDDSKRDLENYQKFIVQNLLDIENAINLHHDISINRQKYINEFAQADGKRNQSKNWYNRRFNTKENLSKFDCFPEADVSEAACKNRGCVWKILDDRAPLNTPYCYYPKDWHIYTLEKSCQIEKQFNAKLKLTGNSAYGKDVPLVQMQTFAIDDDTLRVKIFDPNKNRYEPTIPVRDKESTNNASSNKQYAFIADTFGKNLPGFNVRRVADNTMIFESIGVGGFIFADQFLQISSILPSSNIYGLGEHQTNLRLNTSWQRLTFFNADQPPWEQKNLYGTHPFYLVLEDNGNCHGVLFLNSNAMDVILQPTPAITFRSIGGIFDIYFFMGPTPEDVLKQYSNIVGKPFFPPYWSLGFHLSKFGLKTLNDTKTLWNNTRAAQIPYDTQWNDLDYMDKNNDFSYDKIKYKGFPEFIDELHKAGMHYIPLIDAGVGGYDENGKYLPYIEGLREDIFIKDAETNKPFQGKVWNFNSTVWPDHTNPKTKDYYYKMMKLLHDDITYDGAWIDMNEPSNFFDGTKSGCKKNEFDNPPYVPHLNDGLLAKKTICMNAMHYAGRHYDLHNTYGTSQAINVNYALTKIRNNRRPFIISRSTWVGHGHYAGHWTGDVFSTWHDMRMSIPAILSMALFQIPMVGADICGFNGNTTKSLCNRWMQLGAFYPFSRNHNSDDTIDQDPVSMGPMVIASSRHSLSIRYLLLPYLYTLFFRAHSFGEPVIRPLFFEFPDDTLTYDIDTTFLWGKHLLIIPILKENEQKISAYIPRGVWYNFHTRFPLFSNGKDFEFKTEPDIMPILIRGGIVIPAQKNALTTTESRKNPFILFIALDIFEEAFGELYWDDGDSSDSIETNNYRWIKFRVQKTTLTSTNERGSFKDDMWLDTIQIMGIEKNVKCVILQGNSINFDYDETKFVLHIDKIKVDLKQNFTMSWFYDKSKCPKELTQNQRQDYKEQILKKVHKLALSSSVKLSVNHILIFLLTFTFHIFN